jgi:hypothetical protein
MHVTLYVSCRNRYAPEALVGRRQTFVLCRPLTNRRNCQPPALPLGSIWPSKVDEGILSPAEMVDPAPLAGSTAPS